MVVGVVEGVGVWSFEFEDLLIITIERFELRIQVIESNIRYFIWKKVVMKLMGWVIIQFFENGDVNIFFSLFLGFFVVSSMIMLIGVRYILGVL